MNNRITQILGTKYPLIQAPMFWLTDGKFVAEISNQGGLGVIGIHAGQKERTRDRDVQLEIMRNEIKKVKELTSNNFGINIATLVNKGIDDNNRATINMALKEGIKYFVVAGVFNQDIFDLIKENDGIIIFRSVFPTIKEAKVAEKAGADIIVATGYDEGGFLPNRSIGTFTITPEISNALNVPVMAAGGIVDNNSRKAAMNLGAEGVYVGTRFLVANENRMHPRAKDLIVNSSSENMEFVSLTQRSINTKKADQLNEGYNDPDVDNNDLEADISKNALAKVAALDGDIDNGIINVDIAIDSIKQRSSVKDIISELFKDYSKQ